MKSKKYYTISETAKLLNICSQTLRRWDKSGVFPATRHPINNYRVYTKEQLDLFPEKSKNNTSVAKTEKLSPFFSTSFGQLYNNDAIAFLKSIPDNSVDLVFADPPYNIKKADWDIFKTEDDYIEWSELWISEASRILTDKGSLYICGFSEILADLKWISSEYFYGCKWLVWYYRNKANMGNGWGRSHESILHLRKSKNYIFNTDEVRIPYNEHTLKYPTRNQAVTSQYGNGKHYEWQPNPLGAKPKDVFEIPTISNGSWERYDHPTQKPVELVKKIILASSNKDSTIVDPFGGSGTTYAVCEALSRKWIGCEKEKKYCSLIKQRLEDSDHLARIKSGEDEIQSHERREKLRNARNQISYII